jgi:folate-binding protein YgfZ
MTAIEELEELRAGRACVDRSDRGFVVVTGPDALSFLQALVSADLDELADGDGVHCLLLTPQGKLDVDFRLLRVGDTAWLDCDPGLGAQLAASLLRFRIRVKAEVVDRSDEFGMLSFVGAPADDALADQTPADHAPADLHAHRPVGQPDAHDLRVVRTPWGWDLIGPRSEIARETSRLADSRWRQVGGTAYEAWRIERGIAVQPFDLDAATIPQEAFLERDAVSFTKGCFLGQELVCRIDSRGHVNRFLRRFTGIDGDWPVRGANVVVDGKVVGVLTSVAPVDVPTGALGYVRREVDPPAEVELVWSGGSARATADAIAPPAS